jgi:hypothetical protein
MAQIRPSSAGYLCRRRTVGMADDADQVDPARPVLDDDQSVDAAQEHGILD